MFRDVFREFSIFPCFNNLFKIRKWNSFAPSFIYARVYVCVYY